MTKCKNKHIQIDQLKQLVYEIEPFATIPIVINNNYYFCFYNVRLAFTPSSQILNTHSISGIYMY